MKIYFAPLEGLTTRPFRQVHRTHFAGIDRYFQPFIAVHQTHKLKLKEKKELVPESADPEKMSVPQLLGKDPEDTAFYVKMAAEAGFPEVNINLGCPSPTVTKKGKGAGMLADADETDEYLEAVFEAAQDKIHVSVKTRIGMYDTDNMAQLIEVFNRYPVSELTVHPRLGKQLYKGNADLDAFEFFYENSRCPVVYNGDIRSVADAEMIENRFPKISALMIGRGLLTDPALAREIKGGAPAASEELYGYMKDLSEAWAEDLGGIEAALPRIKETFNYLAQGFDNAAKPLKQVRKSKNREEYFFALDQFFKKIKDA